MVLIDDNFASIVNAVEEGRTIFDNIQKFLHYLLSCNAGEVLFMFWAATAAWPAPLQAIQLLWINLTRTGAGCVLALSAKESYSNQNHKSLVVGYRPAGRIPTDRHPLPAEGLGQAAVSRYHRRDADRGRRLIRFAHSQRSRTGSERSCLAAKSTGIDRSLRQPPRH
jgi:hypothetical protein